MLGFLSPPMKTLVARRKGKMRRMKTPFAAEGGCGGVAGSGLPAAAIATGPGREDRGLMGGGCDGGETPEPPR